MAQGIVAGEIMAGNPGKLYGIKPGGLGMGITDDAVDLKVVAAAQPDWSDWEYFGLTSGGLQAALEKSYTNHRVDQAPDWVASTIDERHASISTNLVQVSLDNLSRANNGGLITTGVGTAGAWDSWEPITDTLETPEDYIGLGIEGRRLDGKRMITVIRKTLSTDNMTFPFVRDGLTMFSVNWAGHFVADDIAPVVVYTQR
jgi:hypothetical protein